MLSEAVVLVFKLTSLCPVCPHSAGPWRKRGRVPAAPPHLVPADLEAVSGVLHRHAPQQALSAQRVQRAVPAGTQRTLPLADACAHPLGLAGSQPGRPEETSGEDKEQPAVRSTTSPPHLICTTHFLLLCNSLDLYS